MDPTRDTENAARYDQSAPNYSSAGSTTGRLTSDAHSHLETSSNQESLFSYYSARDLSEFFKKIDGRNYNVLNDSYFLPNDEPEWERLEKEHIAFIIGLKSLVPCPDIVNACLAPGPSRSVLDLGCGTGTWALEMAREYPHANVIGVDLAPTPIDIDNTPSNCRFELDDVNMGLAHFYDSFDVVHARFISSGVKDYRKMMEEAERCLKPGGVAIFVDYDALFCAEDQLHRQPMAETNENGSWLVRCSHEMRHGAPARGCDLPGMEKALDEGLWDHELCDPETAAAASFFLPIGPWPTVPDRRKTEEMRFAGALIRQDYTSAFRAVIPIYLKMGIPQDVIDRWIPNVENELSTTTLHMWSRSPMAWARRRAAPGKPAPPLPTLPASNNDEKSTATPNPATSDVHRDLKDYNFLHIYRTKEECAAAATLRNASLGPVPVPWVVKAQQKAEAQGVPTSS
ncbi:hypothetical protein FRC18_006847 [Serendipita sp. 400]|nr:hypothetical protein FRC18_006847 [Serendipita sp. 400]